MSAKKTVRRSLSTVLMIALLCVVLFTAAFAPVEPDYTVSTLSQLREALAAVQAGETIVVDTPDNYIYMSDDVVIIVPAGVNLIFYDSAYVIIYGAVINNGNIENRGTLNINNGGVIENQGSFINDFSVYSNYGGLFVNVGDLVNNHFYLNFGGTLRNEGSFTVSETGACWGVGEIFNDGELINNGELDSISRFTNTGEFINNGLFQNLDGSELINDGLIQNNGRFLNSGTIDNYGELIIDEASEFASYGGYETNKDGGLIDGYILKYYKVTFDPNGGAFADKNENGYRHIKSGDPIYSGSYPTSQVREGYTFSGWTLKGADFDPFTPITSNITLAAKWVKNSVLIDKKVSAYVVKLNGNQNELTIALFEYFSDGKVLAYERVFMINNNAAGFYKVNEYTVFVETKGNTQVRALYFIE